MASNDTRNNCGSSQRHRANDEPFRSTAQLHRHRLAGQCFDNAVSEAFFSTLEHEVMSRHRFATKAQARAVVTAWCHDFYNVQRRHSSAGLLPPVEYEKIAAIQPEAA
jgi:transposase InsO family protein